MDEEIKGGLNEFPFRKGAYTVTPVFCAENECVNRKECHDENGVCAEIGLQDDDGGVQVVCNDYRNAFMQKPCERKVLWARMRPGDI
jgi:hypothetical protein